MVLIASPASNLRMLRHLHMQRLVFVVLLLLLRCSSIVLASFSRIKLDKVGESVQNFRHYVNMFKVGYNL